MDAAGQPGQLGTHRHHRRRGGAGTGARGDRSDRPERRDARGVGLAQEGGVGGERVRRRGEARRDGARDRQHQQRGEGEQGDAAPPRPGAPPALVGCLGRPGSQLRKGRSRRSPHPCGRQRTTAADDAARRRCGHRRQRAVLEGSVEGPLRRRCELGRTELVRGDHPGREVALLAVPDFSVPVAQSGRVGRVRVPPGGPEAHRGTSVTERRAAGRGSVQAVPATAAPAPASSPRSLTAPAASASWGDKRPEAIAAAVP